MFTARAPWPWGGPEKYAPLVGPAFPLGLLPFLGPLRRAHSFCPALLGPLGRCGAFLFCGLAPGLWPGIGVLFFLLWAFGPAFPFASRHFLGPVAVLVFLLFFRGLFRRGFFLQPFFSGPVAGVGACFFPSGLSCCRSLGPAFCACLFVLFLFFFSFILICKVPSIGRVGEKGRLRFWGSRRARGGPMG